MLGQHNIGKLCENVDLVEFKHQGHHLNTLDW